MAVLTIEMPTSLWRQYSPSLAQQRHSTRCQLGHPHDLEHLLRNLDRRPHGDHRKKVRIDHVQKVPRCESVCRVEDVGSSPPDELLSQIDSDSAGCDRGGQTANGSAGTALTSITEIQPPFVFDLIMRIGAQIETSSELNPPRRLEEYFLPKQCISDHPRCVVGVICGNTKRLPSMNPR